ncbi:MAG: polyprenyl diphosphate synthase [Faecalibacterium sp.]
MQDKPKGFAEGLSIGIIMDGNGRWAKKRGLPRTAGHKKGAEVFQDMTRYCNELGVASVYFYAFSTENWKRPETEVNAIMQLFGEYLLKAYDYQKENNRVNFMGDRTALLPKYQELMRDIEQKTAKNTGMVLNIAVNYGGRPEILRAAKNLTQQVLDGTISVDDYTEDLFSQQLYNGGQNDLDFILRPSGEHRLSNFMLWQAAYAELVEMDVLWPDFTRDDLDTAIAEFNKRSRRFGGI